MDEHSIRFSFVFLWLAGWLFEARVFMDFLLVWVLLSVVVRIAFEWICSRTGFKYSAVLWSGWMVEMADIILRVD